MCCIVLSCIYLCSTSGMRLLSLIACDMVGLIEDQVKLRHGGFSWRGRGEMVPYLLGKSTIGDLNRNPCPNHNRLNRVGKKNNEYQLMRSSKLTLHKLYSV
ncbi:hypothetical protein HOY82DRAFT_35957 [Tuber indicum]|nr:hypothetical protein HOY82DRAFT_35957 [Tuber indicum]